MPKPRPERKARPDEAPPRRPSEAQRFELERPDAEEAAVRLLPNADDLLAWYDRHARRLPWRAPPGSGERSDPYRVWLSEVMLQQTTVKAVIPYFHAFLARFPTVAALAEAPEAEVMRAWAGLGYYSRARNLHAGAKAVVERHGGRFPPTEAGLRELPGIGPYTAAAVAAIAFGEAATPVDGNIERVVSRLFAIETPLPAAKREIAALARSLTPASRAGDFAQAQMDLGATICTPRKPACALCPWREPCRARATGAPETYPRRAPKAARPLRLAAAFVAIRPDGAVLVEDRPRRGLLGGMTGAFLSPIVAAPPDLSLPDDASAALADAAPPFPALWREAGVVAHGFTHFELWMEVRLAQVDLRSLADAALPPGLRFVPRSAFAAEPVPGAFRGVFERAFAALDAPQAAEASRR